MTNSDFNPKSKRSVFALLADLPGQIRALIQAEIDAFKAEMALKAKNVGIGIGLIAGAAALIFFATLVLVALAVIALALVVPLWLSALIVAVALLLVAAILIGIGVNRIRAGTALKQSGVGANIREDIDALKGVGRYEQ